MDWKLVASAFGLLFLAEMGDKTQLAVFTLSARYENPWSVFIGASLGLAAVTFIGAFFGHLMTRFVPSQYLQVGAGLLFGGIGVAILFRAVPELMTYLQSVR